MDALAALGLNLVRQKKWADAELFFRENLVIREKIQPEDWQTFNTMFRLGSALVAQKKHAEAEPLLHEGYAGMKQREATRGPAGKRRMTEAIERLVRLYEAVDDGDRIAEWRQKLEREKDP